MFVFEMDLKYSPELHERDNDYPLAPDVITIKPEITWEKQHNLRAQYFGAACPYNHKLICSFLPKKHYVVQGQLIRFHFHRGMRRKSPPRDPLLIVSVRREVHYEKHKESKAVQAWRCKEGVLQADEERIVGKDDRERGAAHWH